MHQLKTVTPLINKTSISNRMSVRKIDLTLTGHTAQQLYKYRRRTKQNAEPEEVEEEEFKEPGSTAHSQLWA